MIRFSITVNARHEKSPVTFVDSSDPGRSMVRRSSNLRGGYHVIPPLPAGIPDWMAAR